MRLDVPRRSAGGDEADRQRHGVMSASGPFGRSRLYAGTGGHADLRLGDGLARVLEAKVAAGDGRFPGTRHSVVRDASATFLARPHELAEGPDGDATWRAGFARLAPLVTAWPTSPQLKSGSQLTHRWREPDSNHRYRFTTSFPGGPRRGPVCVFPLPPPLRCGLASLPPAASPIPPSLSHKWF
jgi:hypothetical protein